MDDEIQGRADRRLEEAIRETGARDPREYYRERLRELKQSRPDGYEEAVRFYRESLVPTVAEGTADPILAWREYGRRIAELTAEGRTVEIDATGRSRPYRSDSPPEHLVLHLPEDGGRAILVALPAEPTPEQLATYQLLVGGRQTLAGG